MWLEIPWHAWWSGSGALVCFSWRYGRSGIGGNLCCFRQRSCHQRALSRHQIGRHCHNGRGATENRASGLKGRRVLAGCGGLVRRHLLHFCSFSSLHISPTIRPVKERRTTEDKADIGVGVVKGRGTKSSSDQLLEEKVCDRVRASDPQCPNLS